MNLAIIMHKLLFFRKWTNQFESVGIYFACDYLCMFLIYLRELPAEL